MKKDTLKKHHFWILLGLVPLLILITIVLIDSEVGAAIEEKQEAYKKELTAIGSKSGPKSKGQIDALDDKLKFFSKKQTELWELNWKREKDQFTWPNAPLLKEVEARNLKFGDDIPDDKGQVDQFKNSKVYLAEFSNPGDPARPGMADLVAPTQFPTGGWQTVLRHVGNWGAERPSKEQVWLALEDIWVQRAMLRAVRAVNDQMARFQLEELKGPDGRPLADKKHRKFKSRLWEVELKVDQKDGKQILAGSLKNVTDRLQLLGAGNTMVLKVWLTPDANAEPFLFKIGGEFVEGGATRPILTTDAHTIPTGTTVAEIARVEQVFDSRTVPVRLVQRLDVAYPDSRNERSPALPPLFWPDKDAPVSTVDPNASSSGSSGTTTPTTPSGPVVKTVSAWPVVQQRSGNAPTSSSTTGTSGTPTSAAAGTPALVIDANRKRYLDVTGQVRRLPVAITLVTDQAFMQDVLMAYANLSLRFQITQVHWQRFRGTLGPYEPASGTTTPGSTGGGVIISGQAVYGQDINRDPNARPLPGSKTAPSPTPASGGATSATVSESQLTSGLIELSVYGIVSLYEKFQPGEAQPVGSAPKTPR